MFSRAWKSRRERSRQSWPSLNDGCRRDRSVQASSSVRTAGPVSSPEPAPTKSGPLDDERQARPRSVRPISSSRSPRSAGLRASSRCVWCRRPPRDERRGVEGQSHTLGRRLANMALGVTFANLGPVRHIRTPPTRSPRASTTRTTRPASCQPVRWIRARCRAASDGRCETPGAVGPGARSGHAHGATPTPRSPRGSRRPYDAADDSRYRVEIDDAGEVELQGGTLVAQRVGLS